MCLCLFFTFGVILVTLLGQGLSLGPLIQRLGLKPDGSLEREHALAHLVAGRAALRQLDELATQAEAPQEEMAHLRSHYAQKVEGLTKAIDGTGDERFEEHAPVQQQIRQEVLVAERMAVIRLRDQGQIDDETLRLVERELDLEEQRGVG